LTASVSWTFGALTICGKKETAERFNFLGESKEKWFCKELTDRKSGTQFLIVYTTQIKFQNQNSLQMESVEWHFL